MKHVLQEKEVTRRRVDEAVSHNEKVDAYEREVPEAIRRFVHLPKRQDVEDVNEMVLSIGEIERLCRKWNLRFGKLSQFRYQIPQRSMVEMADYCEKHEVEELYCVAPPKMFGRPVLERREVDPIVLAPIMKDATMEDMPLAYRLAHTDETMPSFKVKSGNYEIVTQWGDDLKWYRRVMGALFNPGPWNILARIASILICVFSFVGMVIWGVTMGSGYGLLLGSFVAALLTVVPIVALSDPGIRWAIHRDD